MGFKGSRVRISPSRPLIPKDLAPREGRFFVGGKGRRALPVACRNGFALSGWWIGPSVFQDLERPGTLGGSMRTA